jgi:hypothetical protein
MFKIDRMVVTLYALGVITLCIINAMGFKSIIPLKGLPWALRGGLSLPSRVPLSAGKLGRPRSTSITKGEGVNQLNLDARIVPTNPLPASPGIQSNMGNISRLYEEQIALLSAEVREIKKSVSDQHFMEERRRMVIALEDINHLFFRSKYKIAQLTEQYEAYLTNPSRRYIGRYIEKGDTLVLKGAKMHVVALKLRENRDLAPSYVPSILVDFLIREYLGDTDSMPPSTLDIAKEAWQWIG